MVGLASSVSGFTLETRLATPALISSPVVTSATLIGTLLTIVPLTSNIRHDIFAISHRQALARIPEMVSLKPLLGIV